MPAFPICERVRVLDVSVLAVRFSVRLDVEKPWASVGRGDRYQATGRLIGVEGSVPSLSPSVRTIKKASSGMVIA